MREQIAFPAARLILAERPGIYADAHEAARVGRLGNELPMEFAAEAPDRIAVTLRPVPAILSGEARVRLAARAVQALSRQIPGAAARVSGIRFAPSAAGARASLAHLLAPSVLRVKTKMAGLYLCGADAEPLASLSGRAARIAATIFVEIRQSRRAQNAPNDGPSKPSVKVRPALVSAPVSPCSRETLEWRAPSAISTPGAGR